MTSSTVLQSKMVPLPQGEGLITLFYTNRLAILGGKI